MLVTNHVLAGAIIGGSRPLSTRPVAAFAVGVLSHFVLDVVPHWGDEEPDVFLKVAVPDGLAGLAAIGVMTALAPRRSRLAVMAGMAGGAFPDLDKPSTLFFGRSPFPAAVDAFHKVIQHESVKRMPQELIVAAALATVAVLLLRRA